MNTDPSIKFFEFSHLTGDESVVAAKFWESACALMAILPMNEERTITLRKLLESRDAALRAFV